MFQEYMDYQVCINVPMSLSSKCHISSFHLILDISTKGLKSISVERSTPGARNFVQMAMYKGPIGLICWYDHRQYTTVYNKLHDDLSNARVKVRLNNTNTRLRFIMIKYWYYNTVTTIQIQIPSMQMPILADNYTGINTTYWCRYWYRCDTNTDTWYRWNTTDTCSIMISWW